MKKALVSLIAGISALSIAGVAHAGDKGAKEYAPGQLKSQDEKGSTYAPGQVKPEGDSAKTYAPGQKANEGTSEGATGAGEGTAGSTKSHDR